MTDEKFVSGPRHDYICTRCEEKGLCSPEEPWRDLPARAARCPQCGAKKFMQIIFGGYTMHVSTDAGKRGIAANELVGPEFDKQKGKQIQALHARMRPSPFGPISLTSMDRMGQAVEVATRGGMRADVANAQIGRHAGVGKGIPGSRPAELGGIPNPTRPLARWKGSEKDRAAIVQEAQR